MFCCKFVPLLYILTHFCGTLLPGVSYTYGVSWLCAGNNNQSWNIDWRDGSVDNYTCNKIFSDCTAGNFTKEHSYSSIGVYTAKVYNTYNSAIAAWVTVDII